MRKLLSLSAAMLVAGMPVSGQVTLKHQWKDGEKITYDTKMQMKQVMTIDGNEFATMNDQVLVVGMEVGKRAKDGSVPVDCAITHMKTKLSLPGDVTIEFDSKKPNKPAPDPRLEPLLKALRASAQLKYRQVLGKDNRVVAVTGSQSILKELDPAIAAMMKDQVDPDYLKTAANQDLDQIPQKPIKKGDKWQRKKKLRLGSGQIMEIESEYEYLGVVQHKGKMLHKIRSVAKEVTYGQDPAAVAQFKVVASDLGIETLEGVIYFDQAVGRVCETHHKVRITGDLRMTIQGQEKSCTLDLTISADATVE